VSSTSLSTICAPRLRGGDASWDGLFCTWNLTEGPFGALATHMYKSFLLRASKKMQLFAFFISHNSLMVANSSFASNFTSFLLCGNRSRKSDSK
jgi:hypothetical protein